jgi:hypothetical protein
MDHGTMTQKMNEKRKNEKISQPDSTSLKYVTNAHFCQQRRHKTGDRYFELTYRQLKHLFTFANIHFLLQSSIMKFIAMSMLLAAARQSVAFNVAPTLRTTGRSMTALAASDNDFDGFSSKVRNIEPMSVNHHICSY